MRYIKIPGPIMIVDPATRRPTQETRDFFFAVGIALASAYQRTATPGAKRIPASKFDDIQEAFADKKEGELVALEKDSWEILKEEFEYPNPQHFGPAWVFSSRAHRRAVVNASEEKPAELLGVEN